MNYDLFVIFLNISIFSLIKREYFETIYLIFAQITAYTMFIVYSQIIESHYERSKFWQHPVWMQSLTRLCTDAHSSLQNNLDESVGQAKYIRHSGRSSLHISPTVLTQI